ncbi:dynamin family protein [Cellulomonas soli]|uniref:ABC transporter n=1 Tax=Cellulomonas soli TaxID=931535 RepID=A0A512PBA2_9CELL|nr:dynamin family protein [Cellulomonas soli]NYI57328.1 energy-coupling factor transporter ATP-binding protein EcfA2 [Cellulomonas soli]GEP68392.1 ABC transporter [Cellulomonas soli]
MSTHASAGADPSALAEALLDLRAHLGQVALPLDVAGAQEARATRAAVLQQLDDQLLPRLRSSGAPLLAVLGGSTGAGKSTLVNSLLGRQVTSAGVLRPTTRWPVLVHHPDDAGWFSTERILPGLARVRDAASGNPTLDGADTSDQEAGTAGRSGVEVSHPAGLRLVAAEALWPGLALLDAPDIDSVVEENRALAVQLLGAADLWLFVTTAARYADAVPWDLLAEAARRSVALAIVLDRVDPGAQEPVRAHLRAMLDAHGLADVPVLLVPEAPLVDGLLPAVAVAPVARWLTTLGADAGARAAAIGQTRDGLLEDVVRRAGHVAEAADAQRSSRDRLRAQVDHAFSAALADVARATSDGTLLRGEVLARWQELVGTGELFRSLERQVSRLRDRLVAALRGRPPAVPALQEAIGHDLDVLVVDALSTAAEQVASSWRADEAGAGLLDEVGPGDRARLRADVAAEVRAWQDDVLALVVDEGAGRRTAARAFSLGVNGLGAALMLAVFASTGGLTGAEVGIAGGAAVLAQRVLEAVFGDDAVRRLTRTAQERLTTRLGTVADRESARFVVPLDALGLGADDARGVRDAVQRVAAAPRPPVTAGAPDDDQRRVGTASVGRLRGADLLPGEPGAGGIEPTGDVGQSTGARRSWRWWRRRSRDER